MDISLFNGFEQVGLIENSKSYFYEQKYNEVGNFEFSILTSDKHADRIKQKQTVQFGEDAIKTGIITDISIRKTTYGEREKVIKGKSLGNKLSNFTILPSKEYAEFQGYVDEVIKQAVRKNCIDCLDKNRKFSYLQIANPKMLSDIIRHKTRYKNLLLEIENLTKIYELGWFIDFDITNQKWIFDIYKGVNRSVNQNKVTPMMIKRVVFQ
ncbi:Gp37-like protein [Bacillus massiliigorillae]|uniref:Gp37-like protein n=1 Tax=Bacillus massiliigorillae TaxID=1243664 RepID=UPI0003A0DB34|nr:hypothetical protein [Bacillus massiliigorillae]